MGNEVDDCLKCNQKERCLECLFNVVFVDRLNSLRHVVNEPSLSSFRDLFLGAVSSSHW